MTIKDYCQKIETLLASGETEQAAACLRTVLDDKNDDELSSQAILLSGQFRDIRRQQQLGIADDKQGIARVNHALIALNREASDRYGNTAVSAWS